MNGGMGAPFSWLTNLLGGQGGGMMGGGAGGPQNFMPPQGMTGGIPGLLGRLGNAFGGNGSNGPGGYLPQQNKISPANTPLQGGAGGPAPMPPMQGGVGGPAPTPPMQGGAAGGPTQANPFALQQAMKLMQQPQMQPQQWMPWMNMR
jgi:hypothetical protein